jgi:hypothetical protein
MSLLAASVFSALLLAGQTDTGPAIVGCVVDPSDAPIAEADVVFTAGPTRDGAVPILERTTTDASGRFQLVRPSAERLRGHVAPGSIWAYKPGHALAIADLIRGDWPGQERRLVLEPASVRKLTLRDAAGKPIAGARVAPRIVETERTGFMGVAIPDLWVDRFTATTDPAGIAILSVLSRQTDLRGVRATSTGTGQHALQLPYEQGKDDATLVLGWPARLTGAIKTATGAPVAGVPVEFWARSGVPIGNGRSFYLTPEIVRFDVGPIRTDASGSFQTPPLLRTGSSYRLVVRADGFAPAVSDWVTSRSESGRFPPIILRPLRTLRGRVVDRAGKPIAGVRMFQPSGGPATTTDQSGLFQLETARPGASFLLASANGFRFEGWPIAADETGKFELTLSRTGQSPQQFKVTLPEAIPLTESRVLARRVLEPLLKEAIANGNDAAKSWSLSVLRWLDPAELLERAQKTRFKSGTRTDYLKERAALALAAADPDEAAAIVETILDPSNRADALIALVDALPKGDRARKLALLESAALQARAGDLSSGKLYVIGAVAERWLELSEHDKAVALFAEGRKLVEALPPLKRTDAGSFLACLARVEPAAALALLKDVGTRRWRDRVTANIAIRLAYEHPAEAEQVLNQLDEPIWRFTAGPRICRRLARIDPARAQRIAAAMPTDSARAYAWAFLADGLAPTDPDGARAALERALHEVDGIDPRDSSRTAEVNPAVSILPLVERIEPERLAEVFWRAIALYREVDDPRVDFGQDIAPASEVLLLARYDREAAATLFEPFAAYIRSLSLRDASDINTTILQARAAFDPRGAVALVESLPPARTPSIDDPHNWARYSVAEQLAEPLERRWMSIWRFHSGCGLALFEEAYRDL